MKSAIRLRTDVKKPRSSGVGDIRQSPAAVGDGPDGWSAGLWNEHHAARVGRIAGLMPQVEEMMADLAGRLLGTGLAPGRAVFREIAGDEGQLRVFRALLAEAPASAGRDAVAAAVAGYAGTRRRWRAYVRGLWYTHPNGRTFLAPPGGADAATVLVAREVKTSELDTVLARLSALAETLPGLARGSEAAAVNAGKRRLSAENREPPEIAKPGREAPKREAGMRGRRMPGRRASRDDFAV